MPTRSSDSLPPVDGQSARESSKRSGWHIVTTVARHPHYVSPGFLAGTAKLDLCRSELPPCVLTGAIERNR